MCTQTTYHYLCGHTARGPLITCGIPRSLLHHTRYTTSPNPTLCPVCSFTFFKTPALLPVVSHATASATVVPFGSAIPQQPPPPYVPPASLNGILTPGMVPDSVPREVRYEIIQGKLQPVEHFKAEDIGIGRGGKKGYNIYHGWDQGAVPPELFGEDTAVEEKPRDGVGDETEEDAGEIKEESSNSEVLSPSHENTSVEEVTVTTERETGSESESQIKRKPVQDGEPKVKSEES